MGRQGGPGQGVSAIRAQRGNMSRRVSAIRGEGLGNHCSREDGRAEGGAGGSARARLVGSPLFKRKWRGCDVIPRHRWRHTHAVPDQGQDRTTIIVHRPSINLPSIKHTYHISHITSSCPRYITTIKVRYRSPPTITLLPNTHFSTPIHPHTPQPAAPSHPFNPTTNLKVHMKRREISTRLMSCVASYPRERYLHAQSSCHPQIGSSKTHALMYVSRRG